MELVSVLKNFPKHLKTALQNIWRNGATSIGSIFAVMITLTLIGIIGIVAINVQDITMNIEHSLTIYVKIDHALSDDEAKKIKPEIEVIEGVKDIKFSTKDQELDTLIKSQSDAGKKLFESYRKNNPLGAAYTVEVNNPEELGEIAEKIEEIESVSEVNYGGNTTSSFVKSLKNIRNFGAIVVVGLVVLALFMISNTINLAIKSRSTEIMIMRYVGASNWYIRVPYILEGMLIGLIGGIIPILLLIFGYPTLYESISSALPTMVVLRDPYPLVIWGSAVIAGLGVIVGFIGTITAIRKSLKL